MSRPLQIRLEGVSVNITQQDMDDILCAAFEGGITYWCERVTVKQLPKDGDKPLYKSEVISRDGILILHDEDGQIYTLTRDRLIDGITRYLRSDIPTARMAVDGTGLDCTVIDAIQADAIVQLALFGEIIYG